MNTWLQGKQLERISAAGGVIFVILSVIAGGLLGDQPAPDASAEKISKWVADNDSALQLGGLLFGLGSVALVCWFGSVWQRLIAADGSRQFAMVALIGLVLSGTLFLASCAIGAAMGQRAADGGGAPVLFSMTWTFSQMSNLGLALLVAGVTALIFREKVFARWLGYLGIVVAIVSLVASGGVATDAPIFAGIGLIAILGWAVWILGISWELWRKPATEALGAPAVLA